MPVLKPTAPNPLAEALGNFAPWVGIPSTIEESVGGIGPQAMGTVWRSNIANAVRKELIKHPEAMKTPPRVWTEFLEWLKTVPTEVMERVSKYKIQPTVSHPYNPSRTIGGYFHPGTKEIAIEGAGKMIGQYPVTYSGLGHMRGLTKHELGHAILDAVKEKIGERGYRQLYQSGTGHARHGVEEPFASMLEILSPGELSEVISPYAKALKEVSSMRKLP